MECVNGSLVNSNIVEKDGETCSGNGLRGTGNRLMDLYGGGKG